MPIEPAEHLTSVEVVMANALRTKAAVRADLARKLHDAGRMTVKDPDYPVIHADLDGLCEELAMLERLDG